MSYEQVGTAASGHPVTIREATPDDDTVNRIDDSFTTDTIIEIRPTGDGFVLTERTTSSPIRKEFPDETSVEAGDKEPSARFVAVDEHGAVCGVIDLVSESWNRRVSVTELKVRPAQRRRGIGRQLMERAVSYGHKCDARTLWLEVTNINTPAIHAYLRMGFTWCGLDMSLYRGTGSEGEVALFMSRSLAEL